MSERRTRPCGGCHVCAGRIPGDDLTCTSPIVVDERGNDIAILDQLRQAVAAVRALHPTPAELVAANAESDVLCLECICPAPCPTRRALDGQESPGQVTVYWDDLDLVMNGAGRPESWETYADACQRIRDALDGARRG